MDIPTNHEQRTTVSNRENLRRVFREMDNNANNPFKGILSLIDNLFGTFFRIVKYTFLAFTLLILAFVGFKFFLLFIIWIQVKM